MDAKELIQLIGVLKETGYDHIDLTREGTHLILNKNSLPLPVIQQAVTSPVVQAPQIMNPSTTSTVDTVPPVAEVDETDYKTIVSPIVGTFYDSSSPEAQPYVKVGDTVEVGDVICIIEAMKLMNEIEAEEAGEIVEILVKNEAPVEYGQLLYKLK